MSNPSLTTSAQVTSTNDVPAVNNTNEAPAIGWMNQLWEVPNDHWEGDDAPARSLEMDPLFRVGSFEREQFDLHNEVVIQVLFKIHTKNEVVIEAQNASKKSGTAVNLIDSKLFNEGEVLEFRTCLYGKSFNDFKELSGAICERYAPGMKKMVLHSEAAPNLTWKRRRAVLLIYTESSKLTAKKRAQASAAKQLIASTNGPEAIHQELSITNERLKASEKLVALHETTATIFTKHAETGIAGGDGAILTAPWDPNFQYRFTLKVAFKWALGVQNNMATLTMPPNTSDYRTEIAKTRVLHPGLKLKDRLKLKYQSGASFSGSSTSSSHRGRVRGESPSKDRFVLKGKHIKQESSDGPEIEICSGQRGPFLDNGKRIKQESSDPQLWESPSKQGGKHEVLGAVTNLQHKKIKQEFNSADDLLDEGFPPPPDRFFMFSEAECSEMCSEMSSADLDELEMLHEHEALLDEFVKECGVTTNYDKIRNILLNSGYQSWTDLVPSLKMTEATLIENGISSDLAGVILQKAQARHNQTQAKEI